MTPRESIIPVFVPHLGCPHNCVFCNQNRITGKISPSTPDDVRQALDSAEEILPAEKKRQLAFYGGSFTAIPAQQQEALLAVASEAVSCGRIDSIRLSTRPDAIDDTVIARLKYYGVKTVELGAQSMDSQVLLKVGRGHTADDVCKASHLLKSSGFKLILQMMTGLPGDTDDKAVATAQQIAELKPDGVRIYPTVIVKDTALYEMWKAGVYLEHSVDDAVRVCAKIVPIFENMGIPVIRLGLNPTDELSSGDAVAGAYHPALGELVKSRIALNEIKAKIGNASSCTSLVINCPGSKVSQIVGQHRCNIDDLKQTYGFATVKVVGSAETREIMLKLE